MEGRGRGRERGGGEGEGEGWRGGRVVIPLVERDLSTIKIFPSCYNIFLKQRNYSVVLIGIYSILQKRSLHTFSSHSNYALQLA